MCTRAPAKSEHEFTKKSTLNSLPRRALSRNCEPLKGTFFLQIYPEELLLLIGSPRSSAPSSLAGWEVGGANLQLVRPQELLFLSLPKEIQESFHPSGLFF